jgi:solute carrier family 25 phosphate transporter 3
MAAPAPPATKVAAPVLPASPAPQMSGLQLYSRFAFAGAVCCSLTHGMLTPVDV